MEKIEIFEITGSSVFWKRSRMNLFKNNEFNQMNCLIKIDEQQLLRGVQNTCNL